APASRRPDLAGRHAAVPVRVTPAAPPGRRPARRPLTRPGPRGILPPGGIERAERRGARQGARTAPPDRGAGAGPAAHDRQRRVLRRRPAADLRRPGRPGAGAEAPARSPHRVVRDGCPALGLEIRAPAEDRGAARGVRALRGPVMAAERRTLPVRGMHCAACVGKVERALTGVPGVETAAVNLATEQASVAFDPARPSLPALQPAVVAAGYDLAAAPVARGGEADARERRAREVEQRRLRRKVVIGALLSAPLLVGGMPTLFPWAPGWLRDPWLQLVLATPVQ